MFVSHLQIDEGNYYVWNLWWIEPIGYLSFSNEFFRFIWIAGHSVFDFPVDGISADQIERNQPKRQLKSIEP
jgi:hypothetical protein